MKTAKEWFAELGGIKFKRTAHLVISDIRAIQDDVLEAAAIIADKYQFEGEVGKEIRAMKGGGK